MKHPCYETWSETVSQIPSPAGNLTGWRAPFLQRCRAGRRRCHPAGVQHRRLPSFQRQIMLAMGFLKYGNIGNPKSWHLVILVVISWVSPMVLGSKHLTSVSGRLLMFTWGPRRLSWWSSDPFGRSSLEIVWSGASAPVAQCQGYLIHESMIQNIQRWLRNIQYTFRLT